MFWFLKIYSHIFSKYDLSGTDRIMLPHTIIKEIGESNIELDEKIVFEIDNLNPKYPKKLISTCLEYYDDFDNLNIIYVPKWFLSNLWPIKDGTLIKLRLLNKEEIKNGSYIKIKPHENKLNTNNLLLEILENYLSNFSCINNNTTIPIPFGDETYSIDIIETKPSNSIYIVNTDINIDIESAIDYVPPPKIEEEKSNKNLNNEENDKDDIDDIVPFGNFQNEKKTSKKFQPFSGKGYVLKTGKLVNKYKKEKNPQNPQNNRKPKRIKTDKEFKPFSGKGYKLN